MGSTATARNTDADLIQYQRDLVRTQKYIPLGRMLKIAIGPSDNWRPPEGDTFLAKYGRYIDLRNSYLPIAQAGELLLVTSEMVQPDGRVGLSDVPDPDWAPAAWTEEEATGKTPRDPAKDRPPFLQQRLTDRCEMMGGQPAVLEGTDFLIFQPVLRVVFQPEENKKLNADVWVLVFKPKAGRHCAFLVDHKTGECHFFGGSFEVQTAPGG
jgi:hypothetical protein